MEIEQAREVRQLVPQIYHVIDQLEASNEERNELREQNRVLEIQKREDAQRIKVLEEENSNLRHEKELNEMHYQEALAREDSDMALDLWAPDPVLELRSENERQQQQIDELKRELALRDYIIQDQQDQLQRRRDY